MFSDASVHKVPQNFHRFSGHVDDVTKNSFGGDLIQNSDPRIQEAAAVRCAADRQSSKLTSVNRWRNLNVWKIWAGRRQLKLLQLATMGTCYCRSGPRVLAELCALRVSMNQSSKDGGSNRIHGWWFNQIILRHYGRQLSFLLLSWLTMGFKFPEVFYCQTSYDISYFGTKI